MSLVWRSIDQTGMNVCNSYQYPDSSVYLTSKHVIEVFHYACCTTFVNNCCFVVLMCVDTKLTMKNRTFSQILCLRHIWKNGSIAFVKMMNAWDCFSKQNSISLHSKVKPATKFFVRKVKHVKNSKNITRLNVLKHV